MSESFKIVVYEKGTEEWVGWRHDGIGKTDAAEIMRVGVVIPGKLLAEKNRPPRSNLLTPEQEEGILLEPQAREAYETEFSQTMSPVCIESTKFPWMRASLDGISEDGSSLLEITCGRRAFQKSSNTRRPSEYIFPLLQHILAITGHDSIDFWCYRPTFRPLLLKVERDCRYIDNLIKEEEKFWKKVNKGNRMKRDSNLQSVDDFMRSKVYVLELEGGYYYVGMCKNFPDRVMRHIDGNGSLWTKLHRPVASVAFFWGDEEVEKSVTLHYMEMFGVDRVRGWIFTKGGDYEAGKVELLLKTNVSAPIPFESLVPCTSLSPMRLKLNAAWEVNSKDLNPGIITREESIF